MGQLHSEGADAIRESRYTTRRNYTRYQVCEVYIRSILVYLHILTSSLVARGRYGPAWTGGDMGKGFRGSKDYLGIIFPIAISAVGTSLMALVSAKAAGTTHRIRLRADSLAVVLALKVQGLYVS